MVPIPARQVSEVIKMLMILPVYESVRACPYGHSMRCINKNRRHRGMTLLELLVVVAILVVLLSIGVLSYNKYIYTTRVASAIKQIHSMSLVIDDYFSQTNAYPKDLTAVGMASLKDPWNRPYQYLDITTAINKGKVRKDHNLVPLNTDYDLYSTGEDGGSTPPLTSASSLDDIVRANNGGYVGLASDY